MQHFVKNTRRTEEDFLSESRNNRYRGGSKKVHDCTEKHVTVAEDDRVGFRRQERETRKIVRKKEKRQCF